MTYFKLLLTFLSIVFCSVLHGQDGLLVHYGQKQGLHSRVNYMLSQDKDGYILLSTDNGLYRFDGIEFQKLNINTEIENKEILEAVTLPSGKVFMSLYYSDYIYIVDNSRALDDDKRIEKYLTNKSDHFKILWIDPKEDKFYIVAYEPGITKIYYHSDKKLQTIYVGNHIVYGSDPEFKYIYVANHKGQGLARINNATKKYETYKINAKYGEIVGYDKNKFFFKNGSFVYVFSSDFENPKLLYTLKYEDKISRFQFTLDSKGNVWAFNTKHGALFYNINQSKSTATIEPHKFLSHQYVQDIFEDRDGNIWMSTKSDGLYFLSSIFYKNVLQKNISPILDNIVALDGDKNGIYLGLHNSGIIKYKSPYKYSYHFFENTLGETRDMTIINQKLYLTQDKGKYYSFDISSEKFTNIILKNDIKRSTPYYIIKTLTKTSNGNLLISNFNGAFIHNLKTDSVTRVSNEKSYTALTFHKDSIFNGTFDNLFKVNIHNYKQTLFLKDVYFNKLDRLNDSLFVGASNTRGLIVFTPQKIIQEISVKDGLLSKQLTNLYIENENIIWVTSTQGLHRIQLHPNLEIKNFSTSNGLFSSTVNDMMLRNDTVYIATNKGLYVSTISELFQNQKIGIQKPIISKILFGNKVIPFSNQLQVRYDNKALEIKVSFLDFKSQGNVSFKYRLEGVNSEWQTSTSNTIRYNALQPGTYKFQVFGVSSNNIPSDISDKLTIIVKPLYWQTWWFKSLIACSVLGILIYIVWSFYDKRVLQYSYSQKISELELQSIKSQFNPHFIYNSLNTIQYLVYKKSFSEADEYLSTFSKMIRTNLEYSQKHFLSIEREIEYLNQYLQMEKMRFGDDFTYEINLSPQIEKTVEIPSLLIQPYVENAIKHGIGPLTDRKGIIKINFSGTNDKLLIEIWDNGVGYNDDYKNDSATHLGLKISETRINYFNKLFRKGIQFKIISEMNKFTCIILEIENGKN